LASAQGDLARAAEYFRQCVAIAERLAASDPANAAWQRDLAVSYDRVGASAQSQGNHDEAEDWLTRAKAIKERLAASDPSNAAWQRDLVVTHIQMAGVAQDQQNQEKFVSHIQDSFDLLQRMKQSGQPLDPRMEQLYQQLSGMIATDASSGSGPTPRLGHE
jgi:tetratricopeptide (TPR) repeat protein